MAHHRVDLTVAERELVEKQINQGKYKGKRLQRAQILLALDEHGDRKRMTVDKVGRRLTRQRNGKSMGGVRQYRQQNLDFVHLSGARVHPAHFLSGVVKLERFTGRMS